MLWWILMSKPKFWCLQRAFPSRRLGFTAMQQQVLCIRPQQILLAREKSLSDNHEYCHLLFADGCLTAALSPAALINKEHKLCNVIHRRSRKILPDYHWCVTGHWLLRLLFTRMYSPVTNAKLVQIHIKYKVTWTLLDTGTYRYSCEVCFH